MQAVATQSFRHADDQQALRDFKGRLAAMAAAHEMLTAQNWRDADLRRTLDLAVQPFEREDHSRFSLSGPRVTIRARPALSLSMAMHELCTNAVKYGALATEDGEIAIAWDIEHDAAGDVFRLQWRETGGPPVITPGRKGFGTAMLTRALAAEMSAEVSLDFAPTGLVCTIRCPATSLVCNEAGDARPR